VSEDGCPKRAAVAPNILLAAGPATHNGPAAYCADAVWSTRCLIYRSSNL